LVFRVWEGPDWVCFGDAQSLPSILRSSDPYGRAVGSPLYLVRPRRWLTRGQSWPTVSRYPITTNSVKKAITLDRFDDRGDKTLTQDRVPLEA
jgi:hypothetical protein